MLLAAAASGARADRLEVGNIPYDKAVVISVDPVQGVAFRYLGRSLTRPLAELAWMELDRYPQMAQARAAEKDGKFRQAAELLEQIQPTDLDPWVWGVILPPLVRDWDRAGRFDKSVDAWVRWLKLDWPTPKVDPPARPATIDAGQLKAAIDRLAAGLKEVPESRQAAVRSLLAEMGKIETAPPPADSPVPVPPAAQPLPATPGDTPPAGDLDDPDLPQADRVLLSPIRKALVGKDFSGGLRLARGVSRRLSAKALPAFCTLVGELYAGAGDDRRAGLAYMRVVVYFPQSPQAPQAMLETARIHERLNRPDVARALYRVLAEQRYRQTPQAAAARAALARLEQ
ncbi:MAG: hypothetical protein BIFFINMI_01114 [Phycisphaerae bacterium]|nr:hypothetical protein [Phycisphaerae bacterium]